jgi:hypothetical protein
MNNTQKKALPFELLKSANSFSDTYLDKCATTRDHLPEMRSSSRITGGSPVLIYKYFYNKLSG